MKDHSSKWEVPWDERPEQNFKLDNLLVIKVQVPFIHVADDVKNLPVELAFSVIGTSVFAGFIIYLFSRAVI